MIHFGFCYVGLIYLLMLFTPNIIWAKNKPADYDKYAANESKVLLLFERAGEVLLSIGAVIFSDCNIRTDSIWCLWLLLSFLFMVFYELYWIRYFKSSKTMADQYSTFLIFPVAGASLPCLAFFALGIYGTNIFLIISSIIMTIGHVGIHLAHKREAVPAKKSKLIFKIIKIVIAIPVVLLLLVTSFVIGVRNYNWFSHYINTSVGVNEAIYVPICGQDQYLLIRGRDVKNPVIVYLHGGPAGPDSCISDTFTDPLIDDYTVVEWDQRGCGRTYFKNASEDPDNSTVSFEQALLDTDALVDYARDRFNTDKVIIMGHSYGSLLGSRYVQEHPEKVSSYVGIGQFVSAPRSDELSYQDAVSVASSRGESLASLEAAYAEYKKATTLVEYLELRNATNPYHPATAEANTVTLAAFSPYTGVDDVLWTMKATDLDSYFALNKNLFNLVYDYDVYDQSLEYKVPMYFISGDRDFVCNYELAEQFSKDITAPESCYVGMPGLGHTPHYTNPDEFASVVKDMLG